MGKIGIVILNYLNFEDTIECIDSVEKQTNQDFEVVIVDNHSQNKSVEIIKDYINGKERIHLIESSENLGFAKGNNIGIKFLKERLNINNILVVNNDVVFTDENYINALLNFKIGNDVGAIGTRIIGSDKRNQNPVYIPITTKRILKDAISASLNKKDLLKSYYELKNKLKRTNPNNYEGIKYNQQKNGDKFILHGSAIFLTENYLKEFDGFYPETFLYYEENILAIILEKLGLKMVYADESYIYHKEDMSSSQSFNNNKRVIYKHYEKSRWIALKVKLLSANKIKKIVNSYKYN